MNRSKKLLSVYTELKQALGSSYSSQELLEYASLMLDANEDSLYEPRISSHAGRVPFSELPVNQIIENYSWKIMVRELTWDDDFAIQVPQHILIDECIARAA